MGLGRAWLQRSLPLVVSQTRKVPSSATTPASVLLSGLKATCATSLGANSGPVISPVKAFQS